MEDKYFFVILMDSDKNSSRYGKPIRIDTFDKAKVKKETIEQKISEWKNPDTVPVMINDPTIVELYNFQRDREQSQESELHDMRIAVRNIAYQLEQIAW